jgi:hypothetical protein
VECGVWSVECGVWSVECGVWSVECGVWSVECGVVERFLVGVLDWVWWLGGQDTYPSCDHGGDQRVHHCRGGL